MSKGSRRRPMYISADEFENNWNAAFSKKSKGTCKCGKSPTGDCNGWHKLTPEQLSEAKNNYDQDRD